MFNVNYFESTCYSSLKLSNLVGYLDATNREAKRTDVVGHIDPAGGEVENIGIVAVRP